MLRTLPLTAAVLIAMAGCSGGSTPPAGPTTPRISVADEPSTSSEADDLKTAVSFATAVYTDDWDEAGTLAADNSLAARYLAHQTAAAQADDLNGTSYTTDPSDIDVTPDENAKTVTIEDRSGDKPDTYEWRDFTYEGGKVASWEVKGQPKLASRLWSTKSTDESDGVKAELVSAYQGNNKNLTAVVQLTSKSKNIRIMDVAYTPADGFKHGDAGRVDSDVDKGGKALVYFIFKRAAVGGKLTLTLDTIDEDDNSLSDYLTTVDLKVR